MNVKWFADGVDARHPGICYRTRKSRLHSKTLNPKPKQLCTCNLYTSTNALDANYHALHVKACPREVQNDGLLM